MIQAKDKAVQITDSDSRDKGESLVYTKADLINALGEIHGYRSYLEICTGSTGHLFASINRSTYSVCDRLMYRCPANFEDALPTKYRTEGEEIGEFVKTILQTGQVYDAILVDPHHTYDISFRDIRAALSLLSRGGTIIVHDCFPLEREIASPEFLPGAWCGVTYKAYLDVVMTDPRLLYCTVDTDYGCGVIRRDSELSIARRLRRRLTSTFSRQDTDQRLWSFVGADYERAFTVMHERSKSLLRLVTADEFLATERAGTFLLR